MTIIFFFLFFLQRLEVIRRNATTTATRRCTTQQLGATWTASTCSSITVSTSTLKTSTTTQPKTWRPWITTTTSSAAWTSRRPRKHTRIRGECGRFRKRLPKRPTNSSKSSRMSRRRLAKWPRRSRSGWIRNVVEWSSRDTRRRRRRYRALPCRRCIYARTPAPFMPKAQNSPIWSIRTAAVGKGRSP